MSDTDASLPELATIDTFRGLVPVLGPCEAGVAAKLPVLGPPVILPQPDAPHMLHIHFPDEANGIELCGGSFSHDDCGGSMLAALVAAQLRIFAPHN